jgi:hypothetical protein
MVSCPQPLRRGLRMRRLRPAMVACRFSGEHEKHMLFIVANRPQRSSSQGRVFLARREAVVILDGGVSAGQLWRS